MKRTLAPLQALVFLVAAAALVGALIVTGSITRARGTEAGLVSSPAASSGPAATPQTASSPGPCGTNAASAFVSQDGAAPTIANRTFGAAIVAVGTVVSVGAPQWNTADGTAPAFTAAGHPPVWAEIYRPVSISFSSTAKGGAVSGIQARALGGTVGCFTYGVAGSPTLSVGSQFALFLGPSQSSTGFITSSLTVTDAWPVTNGQVSTPEEGTMSVSSFLAATGAAAQP